MNKFEGVHLQGTVIDLGTKKPVANAHVIVEVMEKTLKGGLESYLGVIADEQGIFDAQEGIVVYPSAGVRIYASGLGEENEYLFGELEIAEPTVRNNWISQHVTIELRPIKQEGNMAIPSGLRYETFCPPGVRDVRLKFLRSGWIIPYDPDAPPEVN